MANNTTYGYEYFLKDHLGNTRVTYKQNGEIVQTADYYPFGLRHEPMALEDASQKYLYNGKELQPELGWLDYGARMYAADLGRWHVIDNYAEKYESLTPYHYTAGNPIRFIDYNGEYILMYDQNGIAFMYENGKAYWTKEDDDGNIVKGKEFDGDNKFINQMVGDLNKIEESGYYGNLLVDDLVNSKIATKIGYSYDWRSFPGYDDKKNIILYSTSKVKQDGIDLSKSHINLGHEIAHAWAQQFAPGYASTQGRGQYDMWGNEFTNRKNCELLAVGFANHLRALDGDAKMREQYTYKGEVWKFFPGKRKDPNYFINNPLPKELLKPRSTPVNPLKYNRLDPLPNI